MYTLVCSSSCVLMGTYNSKTGNLVHPAKYPDILASSLCNLLSRPAESCAAQCGLTVNWQGIKLRNFKGMNRCSEKAGECWGLITIIMSESKVKKSFTCQRPFPPSHPHPATLEVNSPQCMVSQAWVLWLWLSWCHSRKQGGHPLHQRKRHLTERGPPSDLWGAWHFQDTKNKLPLKKEYAFSVGGKKKSKNQRRSIRAHPWLKAHNQGNFCPFKKRWKHQNVLWFNRRTKWLHVLREKLSLDSIEPAVPSNILTPFQPNS